MQIANILHTLLCDALSSMREIKDPSRNFLHVILFKFLAVIKLFP